MPPIPVLYLPAIHTQRNEKPPWDGCWALSAATGIDAATGGRTIVTEAQVRKASGNPDRPGISDGGNSEDQLDAIANLAPSIITIPHAIGRRVYPTTAELLAHLEAGGGASLSGYQADAPIGQRQYDPAFYDRNRAGTGHGIYVQGVGTAPPFAQVAWLDPLIPADTKPPRYPIGAALKFTWGHTDKRYAILFNPVKLEPPPELDRVRVSGAWWDYEIGGKAPAWLIGRTSRTTRGFSGDLRPMRIETTWGGRARVFAQVTGSSAYAGCWVDLTAKPNVILLPA